MKKLLVAVLFVSVSGCGLFQDGGALSPTNVVSTLDECGVGIGDVISKISTLLFSDRSIGATDPATIQKLGDLAVAVYSAHPEQYASEDAALDVITCGVKKLIADMMPSQDRMGSADPATIEAINDGKRFLAAHGQQ